jgi:hypothetical protein
MKLWRFVAEANLGTKPPQTVWAQRWSTPLIISAGTTR